jgi:DNA-binding transcriptional ArsR family regulator
MRPRLARVHQDFRLDLYKSSIKNIAVHAFDILGDPTRRRILQLLADGEMSAGEITSVINREFGISQAAVSQHLRVLRESGFATARAAGARRLYVVEATPLREIDEWLDRFRGMWDQPMDALATELARGRRERRLAAAADDTNDTDENPVNPEEQR